MILRIATLVACMLLPLGSAQIALAEPPANEVPPPPDSGIVASAPPGIVVTPDGWTLTVAASNETQLPVAPLTTAVSSREYLVGGTFAGAVSGEGSTTLKGGTLEAGYQVGCGIDLGTVRLIGQVGASATGTFGAIIPTGIAFPLSGTIEIHPKPGTTSTVTVNKKEYKKAPVRITIKDTHIKVDGCVGQSFLRSYATLTSSTEDTDDIVAYYGVTKAV